MGGLFGVAGKKNCAYDLFFGVDYHSHLGTVKGGMAVLGDIGFTRVIHNIQNSPFSDPHHQNHVFLLHPENPYP